MAGRGWGKTRTGAEALAYAALWQPSLRAAIVAPTYADARDTCVEGVSGLLALLPDGCVRIWNRSMGELELYNGSRIKLFSADEPNRLRGPQHHLVWGDEVASWQDGAFEQMIFGLRLGDNPQAILTTTPKPLPLLHQLVARVGQDVVLTQGSSFENLTLPASVLAEWQQRYGETRLGRQEIDGQLLAGADEQLWPKELLARCRVATAPDLLRCVIGVDPALTSGRSSDLTGVVVVGQAADGQLYVLADASLRARPEGWAARISNLAKQWQTRQVVVETNAGGELVRDMLRLVDSGLQVREVRAKASKQARAWPVAGRYERGQIWHVGYFPELEEEMQAMTLQAAGAHSPDRVDALVWACQFLGEVGQPAIRSL